MTDIYEQYRGTAAGTDAREPFDKTPAEGYYPELVVLEVSTWTAKGKTQYKLRYQVLENSPQTAATPVGQKISQVKCLKGNPDESKTREPGKRTMGEKAYAEVKQAVCAAMGMNLEAANKLTGKDEVESMRDFAPSSAQPCRGGVVSATVVYDRYVLPTDPRCGQVKKGKSGEPYFKMIVTPVLVDGKPKTVTLPPYEPSFRGRQEESAPAAPPPPPAAPSLAKVLPEGWAVNTNAPEWAFFKADPAGVPQRKVASF